MPVEVWTNDGQGTVTAGGTTAPAALTVETWTVTVTTAFPVAATASGQFYVCDQLTANETEKILVTVAPGGTGAGQTWTVTRGADGTTPVAHTAGFTIVQVVTRASLQGLQTGWLNVVAYGADPTGTADSTAAVLAALQAIPSGGGTVYFPPGKFKIATGNTLINTVTPTHIRGAGRWATTLNFTGTGDCLRLLNPTSGGGGLFGGGVTDLTIDGTSAGNSSTGLHIGDGEQYELNLSVQNFTGTSSMGVHLDNNVWFTEKTHGTIFARNCTSHIVFDETGSTSACSGSFGYLDLTCYVYVQSDQAGVVVQNGARPYNGRLVVKGNMTGWAVSQNVLLNLTGTAPAGTFNAGQFSALFGCRLDLQVETGSSSQPPQTIALGVTGSNVIRACTGIMDFTQNQAWAAASFTSATNAGAFQYDGTIIGDVNLQPAGVFPGSGTTGMPALYSQAPVVAANGNTFVNDGDFFQFTLTGSITVNLNPAGAACAAAPQRKTIIIKQSAGGSLTVAWPHSGSPTVTTPTVLWAGGAPGMTGTANARDVYKLETYDGATWFGQAIQNVT